MGRLDGKVSIVQRSGLPDDIAHAAVFLASDEATFINGHDLVVDGGVSGGREGRTQEPLAP
jgi:NAD(P)-dependent dehydrogenase (short-subunit alcohol dehydrogenase family)